jgi:nuclear pore complex protein Nup62
MFGSLGGASSGAPSPSLFGTANASSGQNNPFGAKTTGAGSGASTPAFNFGGASSPFGGLNQTPNKTTEAAAPAQTQTAGSLFGAKAGGGGSPFGSNTPAQTKPGSNMFSTTPANPPPAATTGSAPSLFGAQTSQNPFPGGGLTSQATTTGAPATSQPAAGALFGQTPASTNKTLFGAPPSTTGGSTLFGAAKTPATSDGAPKSLFGTAAASPITTSQPSPSVFKLPAANAGGNAPASPFGAAAASASPLQPSTTAASEATPQKTLFGLGGTSSTTPSSTPAAAPSLFANVGKPAATTGTSTPTTAVAATTAPSGGLFGAKPAATTTTTTTATPATTTTTGAATTTPAAPAAAPSAAPKAPTPNLGASTFGPTPPAQSRLKNKTMDEIITRWATDLTKYQKEFKEQAEKVAEWDRLLVVNSGKVQKIYGHTVDAERATQEVERQLASVEGQQEELNAWLDRYEREVDEMLSKQVGPGETLQGPDQERERTYVLTGVFVWYQLTML